MKIHVIWRLLAASIFATMAVPAGHVRAQEDGAALVAIGTAETTVDGQTLPSSHQLESVIVAGSGFTPAELVGFWITFPDGSVVGLDYDDLRADQNGEFVVELGIGSGLPVGLHRFSARGQSSGLGGIALFYLLPGEAPQVTEGTNLSFTPSTARQLETVELSATGFTANEPVSVWLTLPDGAVVGLGEVLADAGGAFGGALTLPGVLPVGRHYFTARGVRSGNTAITPFELQYGNGLAVPGAELAVNIGSVQQRTVLELSAQGFSANERVSFWLTLPNGAVAGLGDVQTDSSGRLSIALYLSEALPVGQSFLSFRSNTSNQLGFVKLWLEPGPQDPGGE